MKYILKIQALLLLCALSVLLGGSAYPADAAFFEGVEKVRPPAMEEETAALLAFEGEDKEPRAVQTEFPLRNMAGSAMIALEDLQAVAGQKRVHFDPEKEILYLNQINRVAMSVDRPVYTKQSNRALVSVYPTYVDGTLYVPLRFLLEEMGYTVNYAAEKNTILIVPPRKATSVVPLRQIAVAGIEPYREGRMLTEIYDLEGSTILARGDKVPGGLASLFRITEEGNILYSPLCADPVPEDYDAETNTAAAIDGDAIVLYDLLRGKKRTIAIPSMLVGAKQMRIDGDTLYFLTDDGIYSFRESSRAVRRVFDGEADSFDVGGGRILYSRGGRSGLFQGDGAWLLPETGGEYVLDAPYILSDDTALGIVKVYDMNTRKLISAIPYEQGAVHSVRITGGRYLAVGRGTKVILRDLAGEGKHNLDLLNIAPAVRGRKVIWQWNGNLLKGYVQAEGKKIAQCVTVHM